MTDFSHLLNASSYVPLHASACIYIHTYTYDVCICVCVYYLLKWTIFSLKPAKTGSGQNIAQTAVKISCGHEFIVHIVLLNDTI